MAWSLVEAAAALVGYFLPTLRPLVTNTSLGIFIGGLFSAISLQSRRSRFSREEKGEEALVVVTIGRAEKNRHDELLEKSTASSLTLNDIGNLV